MPISEERMRELLTAASLHLAAIENWFSRETPPSYTGAGSARSLRLTIENEVLNINSQNQVK